MSSPSTTETTEIIGWDPDRTARLLQTLARNPSFVTAHEELRREGGLELLLRDPYCARDLIRIAIDRGEPVGFAITFVAPDAGASFSVTRLGVIASARRRGIATRLLREVDAALVARGVPERALNAWLPNTETAAFAASHGYAHARYFWWMEHRGPARGEVRWPDGIAMRTFDGSERALRDWNAAYARAFAASYQFIAPAVADDDDLEDLRAVTRLPSFRADGLALAYRGDDCVGFCRNSVTDGVGEVSMIGVAPAARGLGLGRALLRWAIAWHARAGVARIELMVDGKNEDAQRLYRSEGFETVRVRETWTRVR
jgi:mycothiol synthase